MIQNLAGIGKKERAQLSQILNKNQPVITPFFVAEVLELTRNRAAQLLWRWYKKGWLSRVKRGVYIPVSLQSENPSVMVDEPWVLAQTLFSPCYIGGWSACEHWGLTEQIFNSTFVFTAKKISKRELNLDGATFQIKTIKKEKLFGTNFIWLKNQKIKISDPTKTIIDGFNDPKTFGGIRMTIDALGFYLNSEHKNLKALLKYSQQMKNTAIFKRLGFVFFKKYPKEKIFIEKCFSSIKSGYSQLDPAIPGKRLVTKWNLWVPKGFKI